MHSEETKQKQSAWAKANPRGFALQKHKRGVRKPSPRCDLICRECQQTFSVSSLDKRQMNRKYCGEECSNKNKAHANSNRKKRSIYNGFQMDSGAEQAFAELLDHHKVKWIKNSTVAFDFVDSNGKSRKYYPDFYLPDFDYWVEIKGRRYVREDDDLRLKAVGENIELMFSHELRIPLAIYAGLEPAIPVRQTSVIPIHQ